MARWAAAAAWHGCRECTSLNLPLAHLLAFPVSLCPLLLATHFDAGMTYEDGCTVVVLEIGIAVEAAVDSRRMAGGRVVGSRCTVLAAERLEDILHGSPEVWRRHQLPKLVKSTTRGIRRQQLTDRSSAEGTAAVGRSRRRTRGRAQT